MPNSGLPAPMNTLRGHGIVHVHAAGKVPDTLAVQVDGLLRQVAFASVSAESVSVIPALLAGTAASRAISSLRCTLNVRVGGLR